MFRLLRGLSLGVLPVLLWSAGSASAQQADLPPGMEEITSVEGITEYRLNNHLRVLLLPDDSKPTVTVNITYFVGSRHEGYGEAGMAHLLEHLLFKGTPSHPNIPAAFKERGGDFNGTTWYDRTNYFETFPASPENLEFALRLEADRMLNSHVSAADLKSEMTVVRNEFEMGENSPQGVLSQRMLATAFEWHNYGKSTIGNRSDIERVPIGALQAFYRRHYQPDNALLIVAGKFDPAAALALVDRHFSPLQSSGAAREATYTEEPPQDGERSVRLKRVGSTPLAGVVYHIPAGGHEEFPAVEVLQRILTTEVSGRLYKSLVQTRLAADVGGMTYSLHDPGVIEIMAQAAGETTGPQLLVAMLATIDETAVNGVRKDEVERVRAALLKERELTAADSKQLAIQLSEWAAQGDWRLYFLHRDRLEALTVEQVSEAAAKYLKPDNRTVGLFEPTSAPDRTQVPRLSSLREALEGYRGRGDVNAGEQFDTSPANIDARTELVTLRSGIKAALLAKQTRGNTVTVKLTLRYGTLASLKGQRAVAELLPEMLLRGTKALDRQQLTDELDRLRAEVSASGRPGEVVLTIQARRQTLPEVLAILRQMLREPTLPAEELELLRQSKLAELEQAQTEPSALAMSAIRQHLAPYPADDPRHVPDIAAAMASLKQVKPADLQRLYQRFLGGNEGELVVVGDFERDTVVGSLESLLEGWKSSDRYERIDRTAPTGIPGGTRQINTPDKENAVYMAAQLLPLKDSDPDYAPLELGNFILGGGGLSSRLADRVRQKEGLSYGVASMLQSSAVDLRSVHMVYAISNPANMPRTAEVIEEELQRLVANGIPPEELASAKTGWLQEQQVARSNDLILANQLAENLEAKRTMQAQAELETRISQLDSEEVIRTMKRRLDWKKLFIVTAGDFEKK
ncbi:MAG: M16 family metallopeptidase [Planctomycetaceae bacterium]